MTRMQAALLHRPRTLPVGSSEAPNRLRFLASIVFVHRTIVWRIAALLTTAEKPWASEDERRVFEHNCSGMDVMLRGPNSWKKPTLGGKER